MYNTLIELTWIMAVALEQDKAATFAITYSLSKTV